MNRVIWKFSLPITDSHSIQMPEGAIILTVQRQDPGSDLCIWALCDPSSRAVQRHFVVVGTGQPTDVQHKDYLGTVQVGPFVWHVFEWLR